MNDSKLQKLTPMMKQYYEIKADFADCILFFRLGDFYEMFGEDAVVGAKILDITLTSRDKGAGALPMCGIPYHSAESYIAKLNQKGQKVAICEQVSDPTAGPGIVERKVVRVVTPSTNLSEINLDNKSNQYLASLNFADSRVALCLCDISTGELLVNEFETLAECLNLFASYDAREIIVKNIDIENPNIYKQLVNLNTSFSKLDSKLEQKFQTELINKYFKSDYQKVLVNQNLIEATANCLIFLEKLLQQDLKNIQTIKTLKNEDSFDLDRTTIQNLEIFYTNTDFDRKNSLLNIIDKTVTSGGGRLLKKSVVKPLKDISKIQQRLDLVEIFTSYNTDLKSIRSLLSNTYDLERLVSKVNLNLATPRDLKAISNTLNCLAEVNQAVNVEQLQIDTDSLENLKVHLNEALLDEVPLSRRDSNIFREEFNTEIAEYRKLLNQGKDYILGLQQAEIEKTGISTLKISYNKVFGFYIEVSKGRVDLVPDYFIRKQTLTNSERYITPELKEYEEKVLSAEDNLKKLEESLFEELINFTNKFSSQLIEAASKLAFIDFLTSFAFLAQTENYIKPELNSNGNFYIKDGRHPVIEKLVEMGAYVPNDNNFNVKPIKLITGPNMGGKSTYLRQTAIITLLAQMGSFVPASQARISVCDQIFTRVGATDNLSKGQSTFMMEMQETAYILKSATKNSLLILDEIGRGTSTFDGVSIAWSILEYISKELNCKTLFATHYHELIELADKLENCENLSVRVEDDGFSSPVFLHKIAAGAVDKSYGIHVAEMAGIPKKVLDRAKELLIDFESKKESIDYKPIIQPSLVFEERSHVGLKLKEELEKIDVNQLTPLEALQKLYELKKTID